MYELLIWTGVIAVVVAILRWKWDFFAEFWQDGGRGQFLVMGMPAVIVLVLGVAAIGIASANKDNLDTRYEALLEQAEQETKKLQRELSSNKREASTANQAATSDGEAADDEGNDLETRLNRSFEIEEMLLEKLISLEEDDAEYRYQMALLHNRRGDPAKAISLMRLLAPEDKPGFAKAHLELAQFYFGRYRQVTSPQEKGAFLRAAELQTKNCLLADESNLPAKKLRAVILTQTREFAQAFDIFVELFQEDPFVYVNVLELARVLDREADRVNYLDQAISRLQILATESKDNVDQWTNAWREYVKCVFRKKNRSNYRDAERVLKAEIQGLNLPADRGKEVFLKELLSQVYVSKVSLMGLNQSLEVQRQQLNDLSLAVENNKRNTEALRWLTILRNTPELTEEVKKIYDHEKQANVPWAVLYELGLAALQNEDKQSAVKYFEEARTKNPSNPRLLNNLAYALLVSDSPELTRALSMIDQAINIVQRNPNVAGSNNLDQLTSSFYDTRGNILMKLERYRDAASAFEIAYRSRPSDAKMLEKLKKCYETIGNESAAEAARIRLKKLKEASPSSRSDQ